MELVAYEQEMCYFHGCGRIRQFISITSCMDTGVSMGQTRSYWPVIFFYSGANSVYPQLWPCMHLQNTQYSKYSNQNIFFGLVFLTQLISENLMTIWHN